MARKKRIGIQAELTVSRKEFITPHFIRVYLTGDDIYKFENTTVGINNKIVIPPNGLNKVFFPEFDSETMRWKPQPDEIRPYIRTYTHRGIDTAKQEIWIDFVAHGDEGSASAWAEKAQPGDKLGVLMHDGKSELYTKANEYLLVGDATAIPVLGAILEDLPKTASGQCVIEVYGEEDVQDLYTQADIKFTWLYNDDPQKGSEIAHFVKTLKLPEGSRFAYVAAEFSTVKELRAYLRKENNWTKEELYAYSYWKSGVAEDRSTDDRRSEKNSLD